MRCCMWPERSKLKPLSALISPQRWGLFRKVHTDKIWQQIETAQFWILWENVLPLQPWGIISHWSEWPSSKSLQTIQTEECAAKGTLLHCWWEYKLVQSSWRTIWRFLQKLKIELLYDPSIQLLDICPEKTIIQKDTCTLTFIAALFTIVETQKKAKFPLTEKWIKKMWYIYTLEYNSALKKRWHNAICSNMDEPRDYYTTWSKSYKDKYHIISLIT